MVVRTQADLDLLHAAGREAAQYADRIPGAGFYDAKLSIVWDRARDTAAYRHLGQFDRASFRRLPVTWQSSLWEHPARFRRTDLDTAAVYYETVGADPPALPMPRTVEEILWEAATLARAWAHLIGRGDRVAVTVPSDVVPAADLVARVCEVAGAVYARGYPLVDGTCDWDRMLNLWTSLQPTVVVITPEVADALCTLVAADGRLAEAVERVRRVLLLGGGGGGVPAAARQRLTDSWSADVYDAGELPAIGPIAASCEQHALHLLTSAFFVEVDRGEGALPLAEADRGRLVVTPLNWYSRALLRYDTGKDVLLGQGCGCGRLTPTVERADTAKGTPAIAYDTDRFVDTDRLVRKGT